jgi:hypothetical protein
MGATVLILLNLIKNNKDHNYFCLTQSQASEGNKKAQGNLWFFSLLAVVYSL